MELALTILGFLVVIGIVAGIIAVVAFVISKIGTQFKLVGYTLKAFVAILIMAIIILPFLFFPSIANNEDMGIGSKFIVFTCLVWAIVLPFIGWFAISRDWYLKYRSIKSKR